MNGKYELLNSSSRMILSFSDLIECYEYTRMEREYIYSFIGVNERKMQLNKGEHYSLKCNLFNGRLDFEFDLIDYRNISNGLILMVNSCSEMCSFGSLSILDFHSESEERIWLNMKGVAKEKYIAASYIKNGFQKKIKNNDIIINGKYIHDYYSFYCELGYSLFGSYGYVGHNLNAVCDILNDTIEERKTLLWKNSELSFKAIDNSVPEGYFQSSSEDILALLDDYFNITLE